MKIKKILCILLSIVFVSACIVPCSGAEELIINPEYAEGEIVFKYSPPLTLNSFFGLFSSDITDKLDDLGVSDITPLLKREDEIQLQTASLYSCDGLEEGVYHAKIDGDVLETCKKLEKVRGIVYAEPNYIMHLDSFSIPTEISGSVYKSYMKWYFDYMHITEAWSKYENAGENVLIAVIDNGFSLTSVDFPANLWDDGQGHCGYNGYNENYDISVVVDENNEKIKDSLHGSNVAGIIGMASNGTGGIGVAYNSDLMLLKCAGYGGSQSSYITSTAVINCITYAVNNNADIITMSLSAAGNAPKAFKEAVDEAVDSGIAVFAAAGNNAYSTNEAGFYPANMSNVIGVMAIDKTDPSQLSNFSNYDISGTYQYYDVAAPGCAIIGCGEGTSATVYNGTSQATPLVAACAALYISEYPNSTVDEIYEAIRNSPTRYVTTNTDVTTQTYNFKVLDALELLDYPETKPAPEPEIICNPETTVILDISKGYVYGLDEGFDDISNYISVEKGTFLFTPTENGNGTGSVLTVFDAKGNIFKTLSVIVYGDINGDSFADGQDSVLISAMIDCPTNFNNCQQYASDVNYDMNTNEDDVAIVANYAIGLDIVTQF